MKLFWICFGIVLGILLFLAAVTYCCFWLAFYAPRKRKNSQEIELPRGEIYAPYHDIMEQWIREVRQMPYRALSIRSHDGLTLRGKYYEFAPGAPIELMFHGYRGSSERDLCGGVQRCFQLGHSALVIDQRCAGDSEGRVITFGIREHQDCLNWIQYCIQVFGPETPLLLTGISMGAATVLMAAGHPLPENVMGVLADCGYTSPRAIIRRTIRKIGLPTWLAYPFVRLGARIFGGFDPESYDAKSAMKTCSLPVLFIHGAADDFVPCEMSEQNYSICASRKKELFVVPKAGHGLSYLVQPEEYIQHVRHFFYENV